MPTVLNVLSMFPPVPWYWSLLFEGRECFVWVLHHLSHRLIFDEGEVTDRSVLIAIPPVGCRAGRGRGEAVDKEGGLEGGGDGER